MSYGELYHRVHGMVPNIPIDLCKTIVNDSWRDIRRKNLWSFLLWESNWISPALITAGTASVTLGSASVVLDAAAAAAVIAGGMSPTIITQRQFRTGISTIYNIWAWDGVNTLTLDRPYTGATNATVAYSIFQCYYPAPMKDCLSIVDIRDMQNFISLFVNRYTRHMLDDMDPQRSWYYFPTDAIYYQQDQNPASPTYGFPMYELWGAPQYNLVYQLYGLRRGVDLVLDTDELPPAVGEDCVTALAEYYAYKWAEANKDQAHDKGMGPDYKFLMGAAKADYDRLFKSYRKDDRETVNNYFYVRRISLYGKYFSYYSSLSGTAYPGVTP